jgi:hypothetical protein
MGLTSYFPIGKTSITDMPQIVESKTLALYKDYTISENINIVPCEMSSFQWLKYEEIYKIDKLKSLNNLKRNTIYDNSVFDYNIRNRQNCNIIYKDDKFKYKKGEEFLVMKKAVYDSILADNSLLKENIKVYSPKFFKILENMDKFIDSNGLPTGKVMYYSEFRQESGSEIFENILKANGYEKYEHDEQNIDDMNDTDIKKRYTFITGSESKGVRKNNKYAYNHIKNLNGEYIQVILISSAGAEGISLKAVRQVHIMEPYWNFGRINQVFGRAIRFKSHVDFEDESKRTVEQYLYLSFLPKGDSIESIYINMKDDDILWPELKDINIDTNISNQLLSNYPSIYNNINKILSVKIETNDRTLDQILLDIMERKNKISITITDIIKESSVDCIQNTRDDFNLNQKCLRFTEKIEDEISIFPGVTAENLNTIDTKQLKTKFYNINKTNLYVIPARQNDKNINIYYELDNADSNIDIRYIRENGIRICDVNLEVKKIFFYEGKKHPFNKILGNKFSVFQTIYSINDDLYENMQQGLFQDISKLISEDMIKGYSIKYNVNERLFFKFYEDRITRLYDYELIEYNRFIRDDYQCIIIYNEKLYIAN